jgi:hypothetical protein
LGALRLFPCALCAVVDFRVDSLAERAHATIGLAAAKP